MKNFKMFLGTLLLVSLFISCKKEATDNRPQFVGTWNGTNSMIVSGLNSNTSNAVSITIAEGTGNSNQIILTQTGSTVARTAVVNGNSYKYDEYTGTTSLGDLTISMKINGTGTLNGNVISESGTVTITVAGVDYPGTWSSTLNKQ